MEKYLRHLEKNKYSISTIRTYKSILNNYINIWKDIRLIRKKLLNYFDSPNTIWTHYNVIISFMKFNNDKRIKKIKEIKLPSISQKYMPTFTKNYIYKKTEKMNSQKEIIIRFLFETGIRISELKNIISINKKTIIIKGKGNKIREIYHNFKTTKLLDQVMITEKTIRLWVKEVLGKKYTPHSIRRSHATHMLLNGVNPKLVMLQLGHVKIETTYRYLQISKTKNINLYNKYFQK
ncbi:tyrosine-type recombinase/integrase [Candidatus Hepatoplasma crinochetorum]|uniref:tyrosine-type recombinase/integrase n=1 Tax=Candidatus Hepatoplasma crinochetorum TaxID=295596 RepID=UPI0030867AC9|nr:MAG: tyrosine recombinase XerC [Candidatus Hepatoplasma crinochetorum]